MWLTGGSIWDPHKGAFRSGDLHAESGRFGSVGSAPRTAERLEMDGLFLLPGFIDNHVHITLDTGIAAGNKRGHLFVKGQNVAVVPEAEMVDQLVEWAEFIQEHGVDAALARVDLVEAAREAEEDRARLLSEQGDDANHSSEKIVEIRKTTR